MEIIVKMFTEINAPHQVFSKRKYSGVSSRVRKRMENKILKEVARLLSKDS